MPNYHQIHTVLTETLHTTIVVHKHAKHLSITNHLNIGHAFIHTMIGTMLGREYVQITSTSNHQDTCLVRSDSFALSRPERQTFYIL